MGDARRSTQGGASAAGSFHRDAVALMFGKLRGMFMDGPARRRSPFLGGSAIEVRSSFLFPKPYLPGT